VNYGFCRGFEVSGVLRLARIRGYSYLGVRFGVELFLERIVDLSRFL
jgi:hypothetical protein